MFGFNDLTKLYSIKHISCIKCNFSVPQCCKFAKHQMRLKTEYIGVLYRHWWCLHE